MPIRYDELPIILRGSPGALGRFRRRPAVVIELAPIFALLAASVGVLVGVGWLRRLISDMGP